MLALLGIGVNIMFGIGVRIGSITGAVLTFLMWLSAFPIEHNPIADDHLIYMIIFIVFALKPDVGKWVGLGEYWEKLVGEKYPWLL